MEQKSIIIIGAGLAGLSTGCYAQMNGYRSQIFEHRSDPGGVAAAWQRNDYLIDGGIHFLINHKPGQATYELYRELGTAQANRFLDLTTYGRFIDEASGRSVDITQDLDCLADKLKAFSPVDARAIDDLIAGTRAMQRSNIGDMPTSKPPELMGRLDQFRGIWGMRRVLKYFSGRYASSVAEYTQAIHDPWLRQLLKNMFLPDVPVWFIFMLLALLADGQLGLLEGGCPDFVLPIEKRYKDLGGQVTYNATVEEILVENDQAVGIRLADGSKHRAEIVVSAADGYSTIFKMLGGRYVDEEIENRYQNWDLIRPLTILSYGVAREFPDEPWLSSIQLERPFTAGKQSIEAMAVRIFNYSSRFAPPGRPWSRSSLKQNGTTGMSCKGRTKPATKPKRNALLQRS